MINVASLSRPNPISTPTKLSTMRIPNISVKNVVSSSNTKLVWQIISDCTRDPSLSNALSVLKVSIRKVIYKNTYEFTQETSPSSVKYVPELSPPVLNIGCMLEDTWVSSNINVKFAQNHFLTKIP